MSGLMPASGLSIIGSKVNPVVDQEAKTLAEIIESSSKPTFYPRLHDSELCSSLCNALGYSGKESEFMKVVNSEENLKGNTIFKITETAEDVSILNAYRNRNIQKNAKVKERLKSRLRFKTKRIKTKELSNEQSRTRKPSY